MSVPHLSKIAQRLSSLVEKSSPVTKILSKYSKEIKIVSIASTGLGSVVGGTLYAMDYVIKSNLISVNEKINGLEKRIDRVEKKNDEVENRFNEKFNNIESRYGNFGERLARIEAKIENNK
ncbi:unnamed protein product [Rhizophagus irregularis]|uniref:Uncharacterized protein n=1 Tax=Rhizophagus irregularis TaxID=588596 RepID=A0A2I1HCR7_9GLOM|nr:hypothetical protein RhiirA4_477133 [Rhizophagus irregularis]CAB4435159.1 unnamed protein product [Rhizophagus irregularis]CAB4435351.1 unnamed protein product [Rhizophagus irregularis]